LSGVIQPETPLRPLVQTVLRPLFPRALARYWEHDRVTEAEVLTGAAMVVRRAAVEVVGPMAEVTLAYGEEIEWHLRFRQAGWKLYLVPQASMIHYKEQSTGGQHGWMLVESRKGVLYYFHRHRGKWEWLALRWVMLATHALGWLFVLLPGLFSKKWRERRAVHQTIIRMAWRWPETD
jgi:GT2 family glycosyltransferase